MQVSAKEKSITFTSSSQEFILLPKLVSYMRLSRGVSPSSWVWFGVYLEFPFLHNNSEIKQAAGH